MERIGNSVVARSGPDDPAAPALVGHLDTVPPWAEDEPHLDGSRVIGRGSSDMKGGDAVLIALLEHASERGRAMVAVLYEGEEGPNQDNGIHAVLERSTLLGRPAFAFVLEPTGGRVSAGCAGDLAGDVLFRGRTGHSARPWQGENAILKAIPFLERVAALTAGSVIVEGLTFHNTISVTEARGGIARNVIPDLFMLGIDVRHPPGEDPAEVRARVEALAAPEGTVRWLGASPDAPPNLSNPILRAFLAQSGVAVEPEQAWTDVATLHQHGVPATNFGPGDPAQAHQPGEWVDGAMLAQCARALGAFLLD